MGGVLEEHLGYLSTPRRLDLYRAAIEQEITHGDRVVDAGCGSGVLALLCLQAGASHIYAIDSSDAIELARESLTRAGWSAQVDFIRDSTYRASLPQAADVVICDHVGYFGFDYGLVEMLRDARRRFLKPGGKLIPRRVDLHLAGIDSAKARDLGERWAAPSIPREFHWLREHGVNTKHAVNLDRCELLTDAPVLGSINLLSESPDYFSWSASLVAERDGTLHGLAGWFNCELADGIWMTNSPATETSIGRSQAFLPIDESVAVDAGDRIDVTIMTRPADDLIAWNVAHVRSGRTFSHSTWRGELIGRERFIHLRPDHVPRINRRASARQLVLGYCDGRRTVAEVRDTVLRAHPELFPSSEEIERFVMAVLSRDAE